MRTPCSGRFVPATCLAALLLVITGTAVAQHVLWVADDRGKRADLDGANAEELASSNLGGDFRALAIDPTGDRMYGTTTPPPSSVQADLEAIGTVFHRGRTGCS